MLWHEFHQHGRLNAQKLCVLLLDGGLLATLMQQDLVHRRNALVYVFCSFGLSFQFVGGFLVILYLGNDLIGLSQSGIDGFKDNRVLALDNLFARSIAGTDIGPVCFR